MVSHAVQFNALRIIYVQVLGLENNQIGDPGLASLADACAKGALAQLTRLVNRNTCRMIYE